MWPFTRSDTRIDQAASTLNPFVSQALSGLEEQELRDQIRTRTLAECYIYGAIRYLASYDDMRNGSVGTLMEDILGTHFGANGEEIRSSETFFAKIRDGGSEHLFMIEGASALRRWLVNGERTVGADLKSLLGQDQTG
ncbi:MAG: hypothetical protein LJE58_02830 [Thiogranum sp.]|jgi:hypothetical protein|nr:hypothetical protein [Thiogranum sp.]